MVAHDKNSYDIPDDTKQKVKRETLQIHAAEITFADRKGLRSFRRLVHVISQLGVKFVGKLPRRNPLVITHDLVDIRIDLRM